MSRILRTRYDNSRCKACGTNIPYGTDVRHTGGYGVTCIGCPHAPDLAPQQAQQPSGQTLASELISRCEQACAEARAETARYKAALETARELLATVTRERDQLDRRLCELTAGMAVSEHAPDPDDLIDVMAPGGVEAWLANDLARIAAEKAAAAETAPDEDDDCPI